MSRPMRSRCSRILIIDQDAAALADVAGGFARRGFRVETAAHAGDALIVLAENRPDLVLLAVARPADVEVLQRLRAVDPAVPVVLLTEGSDPLPSHVARGLGVLGSVRKSVVQRHADSLEKRVEEHI